jgi:acetoin:2,6-dichlorophenolindophenol oxidoreductase subunit beta
LTTSIDEHKLTPRILKYREAISEGLVQSMEIDDSVFILGIGVADTKGIFETTTEPFRRFGAARVIETPNSENAMTGIAIGAAALGKRPVMVHARNDFMFLAFDQIINLAAKWAYMYGGKAGHAPIVVRGIIGKGWGQGATHSQSIQSLLGHFPGLQVVMPATPADAKGLLVSALRSSAPTMILEHRTLYEVQGVVPEELTPVPIGKAAIARPGKDITIAATSMMVSESLRAAQGLAAIGIDAEVVDIRSIRPLDRETIIESVRKTGRLVIADTSWVTYGVAAEIAATVAEEAFEHLKAPVRRIGTADVPAPVSLSLENVFYSDAEDITKACLEILDRTDADATISGEIGPEFLGPY